METSIDFEGFTLLKDHNVEKNMETGIDRDGNMYRWAGNALYQLYQFRILR
jgi:hypothetical protein